MIINETAHEPRNLSLLRREDGDKLNAKKFNSLPSPVTARMLGGSEYWIETLCVQTGCMRIDVCGMIDLTNFDSVTMLVDADGNEYEPDDFYLE